MHFSDKFARLVVCPVAVSYGAQTASWAGHMICNWMGDDGFLKKLHTRLYRYAPLGDTHWIKGKVTKKYVDEGKYLVDIDWEDKNQLGTKHAGGTATVQLLKKGEMMVI
jgi:hypothetical protein